jgi:hypothetical protein
MTRTETIGECTKCAGTGMVCTACEAAINECPCGPDAEPCTCDACHGKGTEAEDDQS